MKCDKIKFCKINILVSTFRTFDNRDKTGRPLPWTKMCDVMYFMLFFLEEIVSPALLHNNAM